MRTSEILFVNFMKSIDKLEDKKILNLPQMNLANRHDIDLTDNNRQPNFICVYDELSEIVLQQLLEPLPQTDETYVRRFATVCCCYDFSGNITTKMR